MPRREEIQQILDARDIKWLLHFTQLENLPSILEHGLLTKDDLDESAKCNDEYRLDNHTDTISMSVHHPNDSMFFKYRRQLKEIKPKADWCVLGVRADILLDIDALFCKKNAACTSISCLAEEELRRTESFSGMFDELDGHPSREEQCLNLNDPTDVQAEILIKGCIPPDRIAAIVFTSRQAKKAHQSIIGDRITKIHPERVTYLSRRDYQRRNN